MRRDHMGGGRICLRSRTARCLFIDGFATPNRWRPYFPPACSPTHAFRAKTGRQTRCPNCPRCPGRARSAPLIASWRVGTFGLPPPVAPYRATASAGLTQSPASASWRAWPGLHLNLAGWTAAWTPSASARNPLRWQRISKPISSALTAGPAPHRCGPAYVRRLCKENSMLTHEAARHPPVKTAGLDRNGFAVASQRRCGQGVDGAASVAGNDGEQAADRGATDDGFGR